MKCARIPFSKFMGSFYMLAENAIDLSDGEMHDLFKCGWTVNRKDGHCNNIHDVALVWDLSYHVMK